MSKKWVWGSMFTANATGLCFRFSVVRTGEKDECYQPLCLGHGG